MLSKNVIYHGFNDLRLVNVVKNLRDSYRWDPVYMCGTDYPLLNQFLDENNLQCIVQDAMKLRQAQFDYTKIGKPIPIDAKVIHSLCQFAINHLGFLQDSNGWHYSFEERKNFYYDILKYWNTVLSRVKPDLVVFFTWPHTASCYPLYLMCKHYFKINVLFIDPTPLLECNAHFIGTSLESLHNPFMKIYESNDFLFPSSEVVDYLSRTRGKQVQIPQYIKDTYTRDQDTKDKPIKSLVRLLISSIIRWRRFKNDFEFKKNRKDYTNLKSRMNTFDNILFSGRLRQKNIYISKVYAKMSVTPDYSKKYLYFAAPYQPEAVSSPNSGVFEDVFIVLDILSASVPNDWLIYYKEHPATFLKGFRGSLKRNKLFYEKVNSYQNVKIVHKELSTFRLIDASQAVSSISGTVGWESVVRGTPALAFGNAWYFGCKSVHKINTLDDAKNAIKKFVMGGSQIPKM